MVQYSSSLDDVFAAVADPTRRGILERLGRREASITALAEAFDMTLTGMKKHVSVLEEAGLVAELAAAVETATGEGQGGKTRCCSGHASHPRPPHGIR